MEQIYEAEGAKYNNNIILFNNKKKIILILGLYNFNNYMIREGGD